MFSQTTITFSPTGIGTGAAYADKDAMGTTAVEVAVPSRGVIETAKYFDLDDEGLQVDLWLFSAQPAAQTDNGAFTLTDAELQTVIDVIPFNNFHDAANGQFSIVRALGTAYQIGGGNSRGSIWVQLQARGALNIAASNIPVFQLVVVSD